MTPSQELPVSGVVLIDKPEGVTSFGALSSIKKRAGHKKVGHAGTLDKFASGLLIVLVGPYTKLNSYLSGLDKSYEGTIRFGMRTDTLDPEGEVKEESPPPEYETVKKAIGSFVGSIEQTPPAYSAVHVDGERAYRRALAGEEVQIPSRRVHISSFEALRWVELPAYDPERGNLQEKPQEREKRGLPELSFSVSCSKGTYIRSLARDLGESCGSSAYLSSLRRTRIGSLHIEDAVSPDDFDPNLHFLDDIRVLETIPGIVRYTVDERYVKQVQNGGQLHAGMLVPKNRARIEETLTDYSNSYSAALCDGEGKLLAIAEYENDRFSYRFVMPVGGRQ